ncbi:CGNR zinc finger domain-containing protein [Georgenia sp. Marseille-Q6866]
MLTGDAGRGGPHKRQSIIVAIRCSAQDGTWTRLKVCARDTCRWAFYDASRNQARRWCSMAGCGNHVKMKRAYAARKQRTAETGR